MRGEVRKRMEEILKPFRGGKADVPTWGYKLSKQQKAILECIWIKQISDTYNKKRLTNTLVELRRIREIYLMDKHSNKTKIVGIDVIYPKATRSDSASFSRSIKKLEQRGLIKTERLSRWKKRYSPSQPYRALIEFTEQGYKIAKREFSEYKNYIKC